MNRTTSDSARRRPDRSSESKADKPHGELEWRLILIGFAVYTVIVTGAMIVGGYFPTVEYIALAFFPIALGLRRGRVFVADWVPFGLILLAYEQFRGLAHKWNGHVHVENVIAAEKFLFGDPIPTVRLQQWLYTPGESSLLDISLTALYMVHFVGVLALGFWLWMRHDRAVYWRYILGLLVLSYAGFATYALFPVAPPRIAAAWGALPEVVDIFSVNFWNLAMFTPFFRIYDWIDPNPYAAMPSLHIAYPMFFFLALRRLYPSRWTWLAVLYPISMSFSVVYLGHHYLVDCVAGALYGWVADWVVWDGPQRVRALFACFRRPALPAPRPVPSTIEHRPQRIRVARDEDGAAD